MAVSAARRRQAPLIDSGFFAEKGALAWVLSLDHKRIAILQLWSIGAAFAVGAVAGLVLQAERAWPKTLFVDEGMYARLFTLHGVIMALLVLVPGIPATLGSFVLPLSIGARGVAFPRLNLASFHLWILGALLVMVSIHQGGAATGWTFLVPLSTEASPAVAYLMLAVLVLALSAALRAVVLLTTLHMLRADGLSWRRTPPLAWSLYAHSVVVLVAAPVLALTVLVLLAERSLGVSLFNPMLGGDPLLFQHFFWFGAHACVYSAVLPAIGVASEIIGTFSTRGLCARRSILIGIVGLAVVSSLAWGEHMPTSGHSLSLGTFFALVALLGLVPATHVIGSWLVSLRRGARPDAPLLLTLAFVATFVLGGLAGLLLGVQNVGVHLHGTAFVVGHSHLMLGSVVLATLAGLHYWWPKITGTRYGEGRARVGALTTLVGILVTFAPLLVVGARGLPRRVASYPQEYMVLLDVSAGGSVVLTFGLGILFINLLVALREKKPAGDNPWNATGLEWSCASPPPRDNFVVPPRVAEQTEGGG